MRKLSTEEDSNQNHAETVALEFNIEKESGGIGRKIFHISYLDLCEVNQQHLRVYSSRSVSTNLN